MKDLTSGSAGRRVVSEKRSVRRRLGSRLALASVLMGLAAETALGETTYPADSARLAHSARMAASSVATQGRLIQFLGGDEGGTATFDRVVVERGGLYSMTVLFTTTDDRSFCIWVNESARLQRIFRRNPGRKALSRQTVLIPLRAGTNSVVFGNENEFGPDLDSIIISGSPVESLSFSGHVRDAEGKPLAGVAVQFSGAFEARACTDSGGEYVFASVPQEPGYVRPIVAGALVAPAERLCDSRSAQKQDFAVAGMGEASARKEVLGAGNCRVEYDLKRGVADVYYKGQRVLEGVFALARVPGPVSSTDYPKHQLTQQTVSDAFGKGVLYTVESSGGTNSRMRQMFWFYDHADYFLTAVEIAGAGELASRYAAPLVTQTPVSFLPPGDNRALFVPFDNDKWIRYNAMPFGAEVASYEVSAFYNNAERLGLVVGSVDHDLWKTGVRATTESNRLSRLEVYGGAASVTTRDSLAHGLVRGGSVRSPRMFVGCFGDWRDGLDTYAKANATVAPPRPWSKGPPFGWNSWGKLQMRLSFEKAMQVSDFFAGELEPRQFENQNVVYIGLDSGWNSFSDEQLRQFVDHCKSHGQEAGVYFTPFVDWGAKEDGMVEGTPYRNKDLYLYAHGQKQVLDGGIARDPTHPGTRKLIEKTIAQFKRAGFAYVKADFLTHGALEADRHFDPQVATGIQAYNQGMQFVAQTLGPDIYLNLSIAPLFPSQYAQSRRIACDSFGAIGQTEYTLNAVSYGWWLRGVYDFNDPDHVVLDGFAEGENRARVTSAAITGLFISGDDFSEQGSAVGKERAKRFLTNADMNELARSPKAFRPVEGNAGSGAARLFAWNAGSAFYLAAFNYSGTNTVIEADLARAGLKLKGAVQAKELWSGQTASAAQTLRVELGPADAAVYKITQGN